MQKYALLSLVTAPGSVCTTGVFGDVFRPSAQADAGMERSRCHAKTKAGQVGNETGLSRDQWGWWKSKKETNWARKPNFRILILHWCFKAWEKGRRVYLDWQVSHPIILWFTNVHPVFAPNQSSVFLSDRKTWTPDLKAVSTAPQIKDQVHCERNKYGN